MLGFSGTTALTSGGIDIDNDDGLLYAATREMVVVFAAEKETEAAKHPECLEPWPAIYRLPKTDAVIERQLQACNTSEDALKLKCSTSFCKAFLQPIVDGLEHYTGKER